MSEEFYKFLEAFKNKEGCSNTSLPPVKGRWSIPDSNYAEFLQKYSKEIIEGKSLHMTELHLNVGPLVIDIDLKFSTDVTSRVYSKDDICSIVQLYTDQIKHYFKVDGNFICAYVLEKPAPVITDTCVKDGIHIVYPYIISKPDIQYEIRENVIMLCKSKNMLDHLFNNNIENAIDEAVIKKSGWMLYGSAKCDQPPYTLSYVFDEHLQEKSFEDLSPEFLINLFSIRNKYDQVTELRVEPSRRRLTSQEQPTNCVIGQYNVDPDSNIEVTKMLVNLLSKERADARDSWIELGICLFNIDRSLLHVWDDFSKKSRKYVVGETARIWKSFTHYKGQRLTLASLHHWAKIDNPKEYVNIRKHEIQDILHRSLECTHYDVASLMYAKYKFQYVCSDLKYNSWYEFKNNRWNEMQKACELRKRLSTDIAMDYYRLSANFKQKSIQSPDDQDLINKSKQCEKLLKHVKDRKFKDCVVKDCEDLFDNPAFERRLDSNVTLLGFSNGVYDLDNMIFRDGKPEDYISFSTHAGYQYFDPDDSCAIEMNTFLKQVLPHDDVRKYVLKLVASFLSGRTGEQKFHIWTGSGSNGKSKLLDLIELAFGDYAQKLPVTVLTQKRGGSSAATPEIAKCKGKRFVSFQEPEKEDKIHVGYMKELTGGDTIMAREMYKAPVEFKPQFKMILACNDLPTIPSNDGGTWRRLRVVDFPSKFVDELDGSHEFEFKKDVYLFEKIKTWKQCFLSLLIEMYRKYKEEGLQEPNCVMKFTHEYQRKSDIYMDFIEENITVTTNPMDRVNTNDAFVQFKTWFYESFNSHAPSRTHFRDYMDKRYGIPHKRHGWKCMILKDPNKDDPLHDL